MGNYPRPDQHGSYSQFATPEEALKALRTARNEAYGRGTREDRAEAKRMERDINEIQRELGKVERMIFEHPEETETVDAIVEAIRGLGLDPEQHLSCASVGGQGGLEPALTLTDLDTEFVCALIARYGLTPFRALQLQAPQCEACEQVHKLNRNGLCDECAAASKASTTG